MKHIIQLVLFCTVGIPAFAFKYYSPNSSNSVLGGGNVCQNGTATTVKFKFNNCSSGSSTRVATPITVNWYQNTVNSTTGGTLVGTATSTTGTGSTKTVTFAPPTSVAGTFYYYCIITWNGTGLCNTSGTLKSASARLVTVKGVPAAITGTSVLCPSSTVTLSNSVASGTWTSSNLAIATVNSSTGVVSGVTAGTARITYSTGCGTKANKIVTVNSSVAAITGTATMCAGSSTTLASTTGGGSWISSNTARATVGSSTGIVTGVSAGTCTITYSIGCGTPATKIVTINTQPAAITGTAYACMGSTTALSDATSGGAWTSSAPGVATVNSSGTVTAVSLGSTNISYTLGSCYSMVTVPVRTTPSAISGFSSVCTGQPVAFTNTISGGTWTSSNDAVATVNTSGDVTGVANGVVTISYNTGCGSTVTKSVSVNSSPAAITGGASICVGNSTTLAGGTGSGDWTSSATSVATVGSISGIVSGLAYGTTTITYNEGSCSATKIVTVNIAPVAITGSAVMCEGATATLANATEYGTWSSSDVTKATVVDGVVTGISGGTAMISYSTGCAPAAIRIATINAQPTAITGSSEVCATATTTLANAVSGGVWSSSNTAKATINSSGVVTGVATGTATISYAIGSCFATSDIEVGTLPNAGTISGTAAICQDDISGLTSSGEADGTWTSSDDAIVSVDGSGTISGNDAGSAIISYTVFNTCGSATATKLATVTATPSVDGITGDDDVCVGQAISLANTATGGVWTSSNSKATVNSAGVVTGVTAGAVNITYTLTNACGTDSDVQPVTVNALPAAIGGTATVCEGATVTLTDATTGGSWSSGNPSVATIVTGGVVTGVAAGTAVMTYTTAAGCIATKIVTVNTTPAAITGTRSVCVGQTTSLGQTTTGGAWTSSSASIATVNTSGVVNGVGAGVANISYTLGTCRAIAAVTVSANPVAITGTASVCEGLTTTLVDGTTGGTWSSNNAATATVAAGGVVTGVEAGNTAITYTLATGCIATKVVTVNVMPAAISGTPTTCVGTTTTLTSAPAGGAWASSNTAIATVANGVVNGVVASPATISYTLGSCRATVVVTVGANPAAIGGTASVCAGSTTSLTDATTGGAWSSNNTSVATVATDGTVTGVAAGTSTMTYTTSLGCTATKVATVNPVPAAISGSATVCMGSTTTLSNSTTGGTWASSTASVATIGTNGVVTPVSVGNTTISYTLAGCRSTLVISVNPLPTAGTITGASSVCQAATTALGNAVSGGAWSTSDVTVATVNTSGVVSGVEAGNATISYSVTNGCGTAVATKAFVVNPLPNSGTITGASSVCEAATTALGNAVSGGAWSSSDASIATVNTSGVVSGVEAGNATISYSVTNSCGTAIATTAFVVNPLPVAGTITGASSVCEAATTALGNAVSGGAWSSSDASVATVNTSGVVSGVEAGNATISYSVTNGCGTAVATKAFVVNPLPNGGSITGASSVCETATAALGNAVSGGAWSTSDASVANVNTLGVVSGVEAGNATISYSVTNGCGTAVATKAFVVNPLPVAGSITGASSVCEAATTALGNAVSGGAWSTSAASVATVNTSGFVSGVEAGNATISYSVTNGCGTAVATKTFVVNPLPVAGSITGASSVCETATTALGNAVSGGAWSTSDASVATVNTSGVVSGVEAGNATITYSVTNGCGTAVATMAFVVNPLPNGGSITGASSVCEAATTALGNAVSGGAWSTSDASVTTVNTSGVVSGVAAGNATISYSVTNGCGTAVASKAIVVNPLPVAGTITGSSSVCASATTALGNAVSGGAWSTSDASVATVNTSGVVSGVAAGNTTISYSVTNGCGTAVATNAFVVNPLPNAGSITGASSVCVNATTTLGNVANGGAWSSSNTAIATVNTSGVVSGVAAGNAIISYSVTNGCGSAMTNRAIAVNPLANPGTIIGTASILTGTTTSLSSTILGGVWSGSNATVAMVDGWGIVTGMSGGTATISYTISNSCGPVPTTRVVTVNALSSINGTLTVCGGFTTTLSNNATGGTWSSSTPSVATVGSSTGIVAGVTAGTTRITYTLSGSYVTAIVTVNTVAPAITGTARACIGTTTTLENNVSGGVWSSANASVASVNASTGVVTGGTVAGATTITYTLGGTCRATVTFTNNVLPNITGSAVTCVGTTAALTGTAAGGVWSSNDATIASVAFNGVVTGVAAGTTVMTYTLPTGCIRTANATVNVTPEAITGTRVVCSGATTTLENTVLGGVWSTGSTAYALANASTGVITGGTTAGATTVSYTIGSCRATATFTNNALPTITGAAVTCVGTTSMLTGVAAGGTWSSNNTAIATVASNGVVAGVASGTTQMTYTLPTGCIRTAVATVNVTPEAISGTASACQGTTTTLSNSVTGGAYASSNGAIASVNAAGVVTGINAGTALISYTIGNCRATKAVTVMALPATIGGVMKACPGTSTTLTNTTSGGVWSSANESIAIIDPFAGIVTGIAPGTAVMSFTMTSGCARTAIVTINALPASVIGNREVCAGSTTALTGTGATTSWTSSNATVATVNAVGLVTGINAGTANITYTVNTGCSTIATISVNALPSVFGGALRACPGTATTLTNTIGGGTWASSNTNVATVDADGAVSGLIVGTTNITYTLPTGCRRISAVSVNPLPGAITGHNITCVGTNTTLSCTGGAGTWSTSDASIAAFTSPPSGIATGISDGTATVTFTLATGCYATKQLTITPIPDGIIGTVAVCSGDATTLDIAITGGTWASSSAAVASVDANTGIVSAVNPGTALISYCIGANCRITSSFTVKALPAVIGGVNTACIGTTTTLTNTTVGGAWSADNASVATVSSTGVVTGVDAGTSGVRYTTTNGCVRSTTVSVFPVPAAITGINVIDAGEPSTLSNTTPGGTWSVPTSNVIVVDAATGIVTGRSMGAATVSYTTGGNCRATYVVSVNGMAGLWTGTSSTSWTNSANWYGGILPSDTMDVVIPAGTPYAPSVTSGAVATKSLQVNQNATVTVAGGAELGVKGAVNNNGTVTGAGELKLNGTSSQVLSGNGKVHNLTLDNSAGAVVTTAGVSDTVGICGTLLLNNGTLTTNNRVMLVSKATGSGRIGTITGGAISGGVTVQQYMPGRRAWRMMGHPFCTSVALNQLTPYMDITGMGGATNGFTPTTTNDPSCYWFNQFTTGGVFNSGTDPGWTAYTSANGNTNPNLVNRYEGIRIFVRGAKGEGLTSAAYTPSATTIRMRGTVNTGDQTIVMRKGTGVDTATGLATQDFNFLSNPYPSPVDIGTVLKNAYDAGAIRGSSFWVWDPYLGTNGQSVAVPIDGTPYYLPANAAFIVRINNDSATLSFTESHKAATASANLMRTMSDYLTLKIYDESYHPWDVMNVKFSNTASNSEDMQDAVKQAGVADLDFYSVSEKNTKLSVDARPFKAGKVVPLGIKSNYAQEFIIRAENVAIPEGGKVYLQDKFLNKRVELVAGTEYRFEVTANEKTQGEKRFELQMDPTEVVAEVASAKALTVSVSPNPATDVVAVNYTTAGNSEVNVSVMNVAGEVIMNRDFGAQKAGKINMTVKDLPSGVYLITVKSGAETSTQRLIKE
jgi:uncharacterized protein YjdB